LSEDVLDFVHSHAVYMLFEHLSESEGLQLELLSLIDQFIQLLHLVVGYILALICLLLQALVLNTSHFTPAFL